MALMMAFPVVMESRELEVCMSALLEQQNLSDLNHLADSTWHVCFGTRSVDKTDSLGINQIIVLPGVKFKKKPVFSE